MLKDGEGIYLFKSGFLISIYEKGNSRGKTSQSTKAGDDWEEYVKLFLTDKLKDTDIKILRGKDIPKTSSLAKKLSIPVKASTSEESIWGDIDIVAVTKNEIPIAIISCKLSLHGRFTETLFYSLLFRILSRTRVILVTPDAGRGQKGEWQSEWGTPENPTKDRLLAETYLDGIYVENIKAFCKNIKEEQSTVLGGIVRPLEELPRDIIILAEETSRVIYVKKG